MSATEQVHPQELARQRLHVLAVKFSWDPYPPGTELSPKLVRSKIAVRLADAILALRDLSDCAEAIKFILTNNWPTISPTEAHNRIFYTAALTLYRRASDPNSVRRFHVTEKVVERACKELLAFHRLVRKTANAHAVHCEAAYDQIGVSCWCGHTSEGSFIKPGFGWQAQHSLGLSYAQFELFGALVGSVSSHIEGNELPELTAKVKAEIESLGEEELVRQPMASPLHLSQSEALERRSWPYVNVEDATSKNGGYLLHSAVSATYGSAVAMTSATFGAPIDHLWP